MIKLLKNMDSESLVNFIASMQPCNEGVAVLSRNHFLLKKLSDGLRIKNISHNYIGRKSELTRSEPFARFHAFLKLLCNDKDNFSFLLIKDLIGLPREEYADIRVTAAMEVKSHFQVWFERNHGDHGWGMVFREGPAWNLHDLSGNIESMFDPTLSDWLGDTNYCPVFDFKPALNFIWEWCEANPNGTIKQYLDWLATYDIQDEVEDEPEGLTLSTIHAAKGLEFPIVIIAGCNEGILPSKQAIGGGNVEEERRLMYVATTRAKDQCILAVRPETKEIEGRVYESPVSRFVEEATRK